jgi:hypothetical protein
VPDAAASDPLVELATKAYIYGFPLVFNLNEVDGYTSGGGSLPVNAPYNTFAPARELLGPETTFVTPNNDTLYVIAALDLSAGPLVLHVPDTADRYYVLQFVDAWTNNFAYIGRRATGTAAGDYVLAPVGYDGPVPAGATLVLVPTTIAMIVGRIAVAGADDLAVVHALQDQFTLAPLADTPAGHLPGVPAPDPSVGQDLVGWEKLRVQLAAFPPAPGDADLLAALGPLGLGSTTTPYADPDPKLKAALMAGAAAGQAMIEALAKNASPPVNGWNSAMHLFDYNTAYLGLGTIDSPAWKIEDPNAAYATRAAVAFAGLWGNHGFEADYEIVYLDAAGEQLNGAHQYELALPQPPPVDAFWSLTMYNVPHFLLEANAIDRYSIGDRTPGLVTGDDGSLSIYMQAEHPGPEKETNWLPTPTGDFRPVMRLYQPKGEVLAGAYKLPAIQRVD